MRRLFYLLCCLFLSAHLSLFGQIWEKIAQEQSGKKTPNFYELQQAFEAYWALHPSKGRKPGYKQFRRWEAFASHRIDRQGQFQTQGLYRAWQEYQALYGSPDLDKNAAAWTELGPKTPPTSTNAPGYRVDGGSGRVNAIAFDPTNSNVIYVGAPSGGLWKSTNGGNSWTLLTGSLPNLGICSIAISPSNPSVIYAATGDGPGGGGQTSGTYSIGVIKSTNGGTSWTTTGLTLGDSEQKVVHEVVVHPTNPNFVMAGTNFGLYRSTDGGSSWQTLFSSGVVWDVEVDATYPDYWYITGGYTGVFWTNNAGDSWTAANGLPAAQSDAFGRIELTMCPSNTNILYAIYAVESQDEYNGGLYAIYKSIDGGANFTEIYNQNYDQGRPNLLGWYDGLAGSGNGDFGGQGWYDLDIQTHPTNCDLVHMGGVNIWKTVDGGATYQPASFWLSQEPNYPYPFTHADQHNFRYNPGTGAMYVGNDGGIWRLDGTQFTNLSKGLGISMLYSCSTAQTREDLTLCGAQDNGSYALIGSTWQQMTGGDGMIAIVDYSDHNVMYTSFPNGGHSRSTDGGASFQSITEGGDGTWITPFAQDPLTPATLYRAAKGVYKSTDRGSNWTAISPEISGYTLGAMAIAPSNPNVIFVADLWYNQNSQVLARTTDGGTNWSQVNSPGGISDLAIHPTDPNIIYGARYGYNAGSKVFKSTDGGANWTNISGSLPNMPVNCVLIDKGRPGDVYVGTDLGVFLSEDGGPWSPFGTGIANVIVMDLDIQHSSRKLRAATFGRGLWEIPIPAANGGGGGTVTPDPNSRWLAHVTKVGGGFETLLTLTNNMGSTQTVTLTPYTSTGTKGTAKAFNVAAYGFTQVKAQDAFPGFDISHFSIAGSKDVIVTAGYRLADGTGATAHVNETSDARRDFYIYSGEWNTVFDGMALVNLSTSTAEVSLFQIAKNGKVLSEKKASLAPYAKTLSVFGSEFNTSGHLVHVTSSQPATVVFLRGTYPGTSPGYLYQTSPVLDEAPSSGRWVSHVTPNTTFLTTLYFTNFGTSTATLTLTPYSSSGSPLTPRTVTLPGNNYMIQASSATFAGEAVSHFAISGPQNCVVTAGYIISQGVGATAHVNETRMLANPYDRNYILYQGEWNRIFDGMAMVNLGTSPAKIIAAQFDKNGNQVGATVTVDAALAAKAKKLAVFDSLFPDRQDLQIYIQADQPTVLLLLRGTRPGVNPGYLYQTNPVPLHADYLFKTGEEPTLHPLSLPSSGTE
ncbi:MAG: hypothetical protein H6510_06840 [Acidobacteria bacterium]|nr:hypothetical protein [Acidobacteriota bacterium]MCB9397510.1 hypothetical protein [Acidobacteriota bacterium]